MKKGADNSWLKFVRMFIVFLGWSMVAFKSETVDIMYINMFIFVLGLLYDYMCLMDNCNNLCQKVFLNIGLGLSIVIFVIIVTKFLGILVLDSKDTSYLTFAKSKVFSLNFRFKANVIVYLG